MADLRFRVEVASSGKEALALLGREDGTDPFGLVLADLHMPGMDGLELTRRIKREAGFKNVPLVFVATGSAGDEERPKALEAGAEDYLIKPLTATGVTAAIRHHFAPSQAAEEKRHELGEEQPSSLDGAQVLLVEDNEINRQIAVELLQSKGVLVAIAEDGREAVQTVTSGERRFDAVLMDVQMPVMDGYEATRQIRVDGRFADLPIIAMTAYAMESDKRKVLDAGMVDHISKPIDPEVLFETLERHCRRRNEARPESGEAAAPGGRANAAEAELPRLTEFDLTAGLARVAGNRKLYRELLGKFAESQGETPREIAEALEAQDRTKAERLAHSLKGLAGNVGAVEIHKAAALVEDAIRSVAGAEKIQAAMNSLKPLMERAVRELSGLAETKALSTETPPPADSKRAAEIVAELVRLVGNFDAAAAEYLQRVRPELLGSFRSESLDFLARRLGAYDFSAAARWLETASQDLEKR